MNDNQNNRKQIVHNQIGIASFFRKENEFEILYKEHLCLPEEFDKFTQDIKTSRNNIIYILFLQIIASLFGLVYIVIRRSFLYVFINTISIILSFFGLYGIIKMKAAYIIIHCIFTTSLTGGFLFFQIIDFMLIEDVTHGVKKRLGDNILLIIFSLPYVYDLYSGINTYLFLYKVSEFKDLQKANEVSSHENIELKESIAFAENKDNEELINKHIKEELTCIICCTEQKNAVINPCGHLVTCMECGDMILKRSSFLAKARCPICRQDITSFIQLRNA